MARRENATTELPAQRPSTFQALKAEPVPMTCPWTTVPCTIIAGFCCWKAPVNQTLGLYGSARHTAIHLIFPNSPASKTLLRVEDHLHWNFGFTQTTADTCHRWGNSEGKQKAWWWPLHQTGHKFTKFLENSGPVFCFTWQSFFQKATFGFVAVRCGSCLVLVANPPCSSVRKMGSQRGTTKTALKSLRCEVIQYSVAMSMQVSSLSSDPSARSLWNDSETLKWFSWSYKTKRVQDGALCWQWNLSWLCYVQDHGPSPKKDLHRTHPKSISSRSNCIPMYPGARLTCHAGRLHSHEEATANANALEAVRHRNSFGSPKQTSDIGLFSSTRYSRDSDLIIFEKESCNLLRPVLDSIRAAEQMQEDTTNPMITAIVLSSSQFSMQHSVKTSENSLKAQSTMGPWAPWACANLVCYTFSERFDRPRASM